MGISPFFTFLRSPVYIIIAFFACLLLAHVSWTADRDQFFVFLVFLLFFFSGLLGLCYRRYCSGEPASDAHMDPPAFSQASADLVNNCRTIFRCSVDGCADICTPQCVLVNDFAGKFGLLLFWICLFRRLEFWYPASRIGFHVPEPHRVLGAGISLFLARGARLWRATKIGVGFHRVRHRNWGFLSGV